MVDEIVEQPSDAILDPGTTTEPAAVTPAAEGEPEAVVAAEEPKQTRFQRRIDQMTRKIHDLERKLDTTTRPSEPTPAAALEQEPQETEFEDYSQYLKALTKFEIRQAQTVASHEATARKQQAHFDELSRAFEPQIQAARTKYEDFDEVVSQPIFSPATQEMLLHSTHGAEIAYYLGSTHAGQTEAMRLNGLPPLTVAREILKLETRFALQPRMVSAAPSPITPVAGTATGIKDPEKMTTDEWMAWDRQQRVERLKARPF